MRWRAISVPRSHVIDRRNVEGSSPSRAWSASWSVSRHVGADAVTGPGALALDERADRGLLVLPTMRSPSQCPASARSSGGEWPLVDRQHRLFEPRSAAAGGRCAAGHGDDRGRCAAANDAAVPAETGESAVSQAGKRPGRCSRDTTTSPGRPGNRSRRRRLTCEDFTAAPTAHRSPAAVRRWHRPDVDGDALAERSPGGVPRPGDSPCPVRRCGAARGKSSTAPSQPASDLAHAQAGAVQIGDLDPLVLRQNRALSAAPRAGPGPARTPPPHRSGRSCSPSPSPPAVRDTPR